MNRIYLFHISPSIHEAKKLRASRSLRARLGPLKRIVEELRQLFESSFRVLRIIDAAAGNHPAVPGTVHLALVLAAPRAKRPLEFLDRLGGHALVVGGVAEVKPRFHAWQDEMRAVDGTGEQSTWPRQ